MVLVDLASFCGKTAQNRCWHSFQETRHGRQPSIASASRTLFSFLCFLFSFFFPLASCLLSVVRSRSCLFSILSIGWMDRQDLPARSGGRGHRLGQHFPRLHAGFFMPSVAALAGDVDGQLQPAPYSQFVESVAQVVLHHLFSRANSVRNLAVGQALPNQARDLHFLRG